MEMNRRQSKSYKFLILLLTISIILAATILILPHYIFLFRKITKEAPALTAKYKVNLVRLFSFGHDDSLREWEEKVFKGKVVYRIEKENTLSYVRATSDGTASALYYKIKMDAKNKHPIVRWKWKVEKFPIEKMPESLDTKNEDDFAARVYVIFPARFFTNSKVLEYIWAETLPVGMAGASPYSQNIKLIVADSGLTSEKRWSAQERDIMADYVNAFGRKPEYDIGAVAFMTNSEHTGTSADSMYDEITLGYKEDAKPKERGDRL